MTLSRLLVLFSLLAAAALPAAAGSLSGAYLAAVQAEMRNDHDAAAEFYRRVLAGDPKNNLLLQRTAGALVASGDFAAAVPVAERVLEDAPDNQLAGLILLADSLRNGDFARSGALLAEEGFGFNALMSGLLKGWVRAGTGNISEAEQVFDALDGNDTIKLFARFHKALMLAMAGDFQRAETLMAGDDDGQSMKLSAGAVVARIQILAQLEQSDRAIAWAEAAMAEGFAEPAIRDLRDRLKAGELPAWEFVTSPTEGAGEAVLVLADALAREAADSYALLYARLAAHVRPGADDVYLLTASILEEQGQYDLASESYAAISGDSPAYLVAEIGRAEALRASGARDGAEEVLRALGDRYPEAAEVPIAIGDLLRSEEDYAGAEAAYSDALALVPDIQAQHWVLYYARGITRERQNHWPEAEADFREALKLMPRQALVLNYLGYSMIEKGINTEEAKAMIIDAAAQRRDDGYITDSLGWMYYRIGEFEQAVPEMERAVELLPTDPVLNDHLGDVLWMVGRKREAEFQWKRALSFEPEEKDAPRIRRKLEVGLDVVLEEEAEGTETETADGG